MSREKKVTLRDHASYWSVNDVIKNVEITLKFERDLMILRHLLNIHNLSFHDLWKSASLDFCKSFWISTQVLFTIDTKFLFPGTIWVKLLFGGKLFLQFCKKKKCFQMYVYKNSLHFILQYGFIENEVISIKSSAFSQNLITFIFVYTPFLRYPVISFLSIRNAIFIVVR